MAEQTPRLVTPDRLARRLGVDPAWVEELIASGVIPYLRAGSTGLVDRVVVERHLAEMILRGRTVELCGLRETAAALGMKGRELQQMAEEGRVQAFKIGKSWGFLPEVVRAHLMQMGQNHAETWHRKHFGPRRGRGGAAEATSATGPIAHVKQSETSNAPRQGPADGERENTIGGIVPDQDGPDQQDSR